MFVYFTIYNLPDVPSNPVLQQSRSGVNVSNNYYEQIHIRDVELAVS